MPDSILLFICSHSKIFKLRLSHEVAANSLVTMLLMTLPVGL